VYSNKEYKLAQFGKYDGDSKGAGVKVLHFIRSQDLVEFKKKINNCSYYNIDEANEIVLNNYGDAFNSPTGAYYHLGSVIGADVLYSVMNDNKTKFIDNLGFAALGLICKWVWLIDLDSNKLEVYKLNNSSILTESDRFFSLNLCGILGENTAFIPSLIFGDSDLPSDIIDVDPKNVNYQPVKINKSFDISNFPIIKIRKASNLYRQFVIMARMYRNCLMDCPQCSSFVRKFL
jgi:hypothetical protein